MSKRLLYREYDEKGNLIKLECCKCGEIKSVNNFNKSKSKKDGYVVTCKECRQNYVRNHYKNNKEKILNQCKEYRINNKEKEKERHTQYYINNRSKILNYCKEYQLNNKDKRNEYRKQYYVINKEKEIQKRKEYVLNNKDKIKKHRHIYYIENTQKEVIKIYDNITKNLYPNNGIQYGIIYGVHCKVTDRWYIGQTTNTFDIRYHGDFFNCKNCELSEDNEKLQLLQDDIKKYGQENFEIFEVIDVAFSEKELDEKEVYYIDLYKAYDEGYNSTRGNIFKHEKSKRKGVI